jgi:hypothetical protein
MNTKFTSPYVLFRLNFGKIPALYTFLLFDKSCLIRLISSIGFDVVST